MNREEAMALAEERGFNRYEFEHAVEMRDIFRTDAFQFRSWDDTVTLTHWANFLTEDEMESVK